MKTHLDLDVWKLSIQLVKDTYKLTEQLPPNERFEICKQMRRAVFSIPSNIAEGAGRGTKKEFIRFLRIAMGSLAELETQVIVTRELEFIEEPQEYMHKLNIVRLKLAGLIRYQQSQITET